MLAGTRFLKNALTLFRTRTQMAESKPLLGCNSARDDDEFPMPLVSRRGHRSLVAEDAPDCTGLCTQRRFIVFFLLVAVGAIIALSLTMSFKEQGGPGGNKAVVPTPAPPPPVAPTTTLLPTTTTTTAKGTTTTTTTTTTTAMTPAPTTTTKKP